MYSWSVSFQWRLSASDVLLCPVKSFWSRNSLASVKPVQIVGATRIVSGLVWLSSLTVVGHEHVMVALSCFPG